jgi:hypothetical protein
MRALHPGLTLAALYAVYVIGRIDREARTGRRRFRSSADAARARRHSGNRSLLVLTIISTWPPRLTGRSTYNKYNPGRRDDERIVLTMAGRASAVAFVIAGAQQAAERRPPVEDRERVTFVLIPPLALIFLVLARSSSGSQRRPRRCDGRQPARSSWRWRGAAVAVAFEAGDEHDGEAVDFRRLHPRRRRVFSLTFYGVNGHVWVEHLLTSLPAGQLGLPDRRQHPDLRARFLPRLLRALVHRHPLIGPSPKARHRSHLVRRAARGQHADVVHAPAVRIRALLPAQRRAGQGVRRPDHGSSDGGGHHGTDLLGRGPVRGHPGHHGRLIIAFPDIVSGGLATKEKVDIRNIRIEAPLETSPGGEAGSSGNTDQDDATKALEKEMSGGNAEKAPEPAAAPAAEPATVPSAEPKK